MSDSKEISADWKAALAKQTQAVMVKEPDFDGIPSISLRHGRMSLNDQPFPNDEVQCIIIGATLERTWYDRAFDPEDKAPPECFALGEVASELLPHENVPTPPANACKGCPMAEFGTAMQGKGPACKTRMRILVVPCPDNVTPEQLKEPEMAFIKVSPTSVVNYNGLGSRTNPPGYEKTLASKGQAVWGAITIVRNRPHPKKMAEVTFEFVKQLDSDELMAAAYALHIKHAQDMMSAFTYDEEGGDAPAAPEASKAGKAKY